MSSNRKNTAHSVFQRLLNRARTSNMDFNHLLLRYGVERFLYRLSISPYSNRFILKGASLFLVWKGENYRVTKDVDLLGIINSDRQLLTDIFRDICKMTCRPDDGIIFLSDSLKTEEIRENKEYDGLRITLKGILNQANIPVQIDIGYGDTVTPAPEIIEYPTLLNDPVPILKAYPKYTLLAEKLETIIHLGLANSRMKDFYDIWLLSRLFSFDGITLGRAIVNTFSNRNTALPESIPFSFTASFYEVPQKQIQWNAFVRKTKPEIHAGDLEAVVSEISKFILPVVERIRNETHLKAEWTPDQGWIPR